MNTQRPASFAAHMLSLFAALLVAQSPTNEAALRKLIDTQLVSVASGGFEPTFRRGGRSFKVSDDDWKSAFVLVPEAHELALSARKAHDFGMKLFTIGTVIQLTGLLGVSGLLIVSVLVGTALIPLTPIIVVALICSGLALAGAVVSLIGVPSLTRAQTQSYETVAMYNHGLTRLPGATILSLPIGP